MTLVRSLVLITALLAAAGGVFVLGRALGEAKADVVVEAAHREHEDVRKLAALFREKVDDLELAAVKARAEAAELETVREQAVAARWASEENKRREAIGALRSEIDQLNGRLVSSRTESDASEKKFQRIQEAADPSVFLIYCEFSWRKRDDDGRWSERTDTGWGTGFAASEDGHIITCKHVVQPWKFDSELAALEAQGLAQVLPHRVRIAVWPAGAACLDKDRSVMTGAGFDTWDRKNLELAAIAPDSMAENRLHVAGAAVTYRVHESSNNDLAVLVAHGARLRPLDFLTPAQAPLRKLDRVMALGFPRGERGLEASLAVTSPAVGVVRKVEATIHVTTPLIPGNSGGPVFNEAGQVVGVATRIYSETLGICIKIEHALALLDRVRSKPAPSVLAGDTQPRKPAGRAPVTQDAALTRTAEDR